MIQSTKGCLQSVGVWVDKVIDSKLINQWTKYSFFVVELIEQSTNYEFQSIDDGLVNQIVGLSYYSNE